MKYWSQYSGSSFSIVLLEHGRYDTGSPSGELQREGILHITKGALGQRLPLLTHCSPPSPPFFFLQHVLETSLWCSLFIRPPQTNCPRAAVSARTCCSSGHLTTVPHGPGRVREMWRWPRLFTLVVQEEWDYTCTKGATCKHDLSALSWVEPWPNGQRPGSELWCFETVGPTDCTIHVHIEIFNSAWILRKQIPCTRFDVSATLLLLALNCYDWHIFAYFLQLKVAFGLSGCYFTA